MERAREWAHAARVLRRSPGLTFLSIVTMGVGIGVSAIMATLVNTIVLSPLPYPDSDRLVRIFGTNPEAGVERTGAASGNLADWRERAGVFDGLAGYYVMGRTVSFDAGADVLITAQVTGGFFQLFQVSPAVGRWFSVDETERAVFSNAAAPIGADPVAMLAHGTWIERFGGDPDVVGRTVVIERRPFRIVGVMPAGFAMPEAGVQLWIPWHVSRQAPRDQHYLGAVARLKPGLALDMAEERLNVVARELADEYPATNRGWRTRLSPLAAETVGATAVYLWILFAAVVVVLVVVCANVALLSIVRALDRSEETAVRLALGASSGRLLREFLAESTLLASAGGLVGLALAIAGLRLIPGVMTSVPRLHEVAVDGGVLPFTAAVTVLAAIVSGLPHAWVRMRVAPAAGMAAVTLRSTEGPGRRWLRDGIVVWQVAMAVVLMMGAGLLVRSYLHLRSADPGFDPKGVLVAPIFLDSVAYSSGERTRAYYRALFEQLSAVPGVVAVGGATTVPTSPLGPDFERPVWPEHSASVDERALASVRMVTPGYFEALGLRIAEGRRFDDRDSPTSPPVVMISETLARRMWPNQPVVGKRLVVDYSTTGTYPYEIVGVVGDLRFRGPRSRPLAEIYLPHAQRSYLILNVVVKSAGDPRALMAPVRAALSSIDPQKPAQGLYPLEDLVGSTYGRERQVMITLLVFAAAATLLAMLSIYGVTAQRVREQSRDIGVRMAIGADQRRVLQWIFGSGLRLIAIGFVIGLLAAQALSRLLDRLLFEVSATDAVTAAAVITVLLPVGGLALLVPSWRATRIDPVRVLRRG